jgi:hypothetical protein
MENSVNPTLYYDFNDVCSGLFKLRRSITWVKIGKKYPSQSGGILKPYMEQALSVFK